MSSSFFSKNQIKLDETVSTNDFLFDLDKMKFIDSNIVVTANFQKSGRGKKIRKWESKKGKNLLLSILFKHKLKFLEEATKLFSNKKSANNDLVVLVGDLNIAPHEMDVWSHQQLKNIVSHTEIEIKKLKNFLESFQFEDAIRLTQGYEKKIYSWWSYRAKDWKKSNRGRRLDHIWVSQKMSKYLEKAFIEENVRGWKRPSDHVPVVADFKFN